MIQRNLIMASITLNNSQNFFDMQTLTLSGGETGHELIAHNGNNTINGSIFTDFIFGKGGDDTIKGMASGDHIDGGSGNDTLYAGDGNSNFNGAGNDFLLGGTGSDILVSRDGGNDRLTGNAGDDIYVTNFDGITRVNDDWTATQTTNVAGYTGGNDTVWVETGILLANVGFGRAGDNLFIYDRTDPNAAANHVELNEFFNASTADDIEVINIVGTNGSIAYSHAAFDAAFGA